jgi:membrane protein required for colicin V production
MTFTGLDIVVLIAIGAAGIFGLMRGFVTEVLALLVWVVIVIALKFLHTPLSLALTGPVGTTQGAAVLAFAIIAGVTYFGGRMVANAVGARARSSFLGPVDRALGLGFGMLKGLILASLAFLMVVLVIDTVSGGPSERPDWMTRSMTYPLLDTTSAFVADFVDKRRKGEPVFGGEGAGNATHPADKPGDVEVAPE